MTSKTYSRQELYAFKDELEKGGYRVTKTTSTGEKVSFIDFDDYLIDKSAMVRQSDGYGPAINKDNVPLYEELTNKWDQLCNMLNKKAYAEAKELEELAAMHT